MDSIKIHKAERTRKRENKNNYFQYFTPPKYTQRNSVYNTVRKWEKQMGYDFQCAEHEINPMLREMRQEFQDKAIRYCGKGQFRKKQTRFDKMKIKQETGFKLQQLPIKKKFRRADQIVQTLMKKQALFALLRCR